MVCFYVTVVFCLSLTAVVCFSLTTVCLLQSRVSFSLNLISLSYLPCNFLQFFVIYHIRQNTQLCFVYAVICSKKALRHHTTRDRNQTLKHTLNQFSCPTQQSDLTTLDPSSSWTSPRLGVSATSVKDKFFNQFNNKGWLTGGYVGKDCMNKNLVASKL